MAIKERHKKPVDVIIRLIIFETTSPQWSPIIPENKLEIETKIVVIVNILSNNRSLPLPGLKMFKDQV